ncbi:MAG: hydantoinase/oxoprolinase family protein [Alphaproteobacteria bacterium]|nr:hydantoinase/oxoprolinase family protein [Alphaproteobacteria bacterium]
MKLVGVDVGGTFTDLIITDTATQMIAIHKVPTTPDDPSVGVTDGIVALCQRNGIDPGTVDHVFHGTTIATNAVLEYKGSVAGMITTEGYRDIIHIGRHQRPENYSIMQDIPWQARPLVKRRHRLTVSERLTPPKGEVLKVLDEDAVRRAARALKAAGVQSIAVCFLFSYIDPRHEERARDLILEEFPEAFVTTSAQVAPQFREFERFTTAAMNAFIGPKVRTYVKRFEDRLTGAGIKADLHIMASNGGVATASTVADVPVVTLLSGPAAGVLGGAWAAALSDRRRIITFDVGGTSADIAIVIDGRTSEATARDTWIGGYPVLVPMIDIHTIGAGGGSIAHVDGGGAFRVGPMSAGSQPGPACYARGGDRPTVTDANLVLGRLDKDNFLGGDMTLDEAAAHRVITELAKQVKLDKLEAAEGVITILNSNMANAIRAKTVQKGLDPRNFALVAFGGAGPLHGAEVAAALNIPEVVIPPHPGITSAAGLLTTDIKYDQIKTEFQVKGSVDLDKLSIDFARLEALLTKQFAADGIARGEVTLQRFGDLRYVGQGYELRVPFPAHKLDAAALEQAWNAFHDQHKHEYGHFFAESPIEIVNIRVTGIGGMPKIGKPEVSAGRSVEAALVKRGQSAFRMNGVLGTYDTAYYRRELLPLETPIAGPAIILQRDTTTVVPPGWSAVADKGGNLILRETRKD